MLLVQYQHHHVEVVDLRLIVHAEQQDYVVHPTFFLVIQYWQYTKEKPPLVQVQSSEDLGLDPWKITKLVTTNTMAVAFSFPENLDLVSVWDEGTMEEYASTQKRPGG